MTELLRRLIRKTNVSRRSLGCCVIVIFFLVTVSIDENAGFCFGVVNAINTAEERLSAGGKLYCLGDIVHNSAEVQRLQNKGLEVIGYDQLAAIAKSSSSGVNVLIRAHGEPPSTYRRAEQLGINIIDATCPMVLALQRKVRKGYEEMLAVGGQVVIFGKPGHAEVIGLNGQTDDSAIIISSPSEIDAIDFSRPIRLFSQTTKNRDEYNLLTDNIRQRVTTADFISYDTICNRVVGRTVQLTQYAQSVDALIFVGGEHSSNAHYLFEFCTSVQPRTYFISHPSQLKPEWYAGAKSIGITGATSTPRWLMEQVAELIADATQA